MFIHIQYSNNILADAISGLKALDIHKDPLDYPKTSDTIACIAKMVITDIQTLSSDQLCTRQKDLYCRNFAAQSHCKTKNTFTLVMISPDGPLQKHHHVHGLKDNVTVALHSVIPVILHEVHNSKGHQGAIHTF